MSDVSASVKASTEKVSDVFNRFDVRFNFQQLNI